MRKLLTISASLLALLAMAGVAIAADGGSRFMDSNAIAAAYLAAALGLGIAAFGCAIGQGLGLKAACEGTARNPEAGGKLMVTLILGLAFIESLAIYALVVSMIILFVNPLF